MEEIVTKIEKWMSIRGLNAPELAEKLNMNRSTVVHIIGRRNKPSLQFIINLAQFDSELDLRQLLTDESSLSNDQIKVNKAKENHSAMVRNQPSASSSKELIVLNTDGTYKTFVEQ